MKDKKEKKFALCIKNDECDDLELRKIYEVLPDVRASRKLLAHRGLNNRCRIITIRVIC